jgi:hypothetical protein
MALDGITVGAATAAAPMAEARRKLPRESLVFVFIIKSFRVKLDL